MDKLSIWKKSEIFFNTSTTKTPQSLLEKEESAPEELQPNLLEMPKIIDKRKIWTKFQEEEMQYDSLLGETISKFV